MSTFASILVSQNNWHRQHNILNDCIVSVNGLCKLTENDQIKKNNPYNFFPIVSKERYKFQAEDIKSSPEIVSEHLNMMFISWNL